MNNSLKAAVSTEESSSPGASWKSNVGFFTVLQSTVAWAASGEQSQPLLSLSEHHRNTAMPVGRPNPPNLKKSAMSQILQLGSFPSQEGFI